MFDVMKIRQDFPMFRSNPDLIYFDSAATAFKPQPVIDAVTDFYTRHTVNTHVGDYDLSHYVSGLFEETRETLRRFLNARDPHEIVFTNGATSALNLAAYGWGAKHLKEGDVILLTEAEHASNVLPWFKVTEMTGAKVEYIPLESDGTLTVENFRKAMHEKVKLVSVASVTNVLGYVVPVKEIAKIAHEYGAVVVVDGAQSVPHVKIDVQDLDCDFLAFSAHKMCAPGGSGVLYGKKELLEDTDPLMVGGGSNARFDLCGNLKLKDVPWKFEAGTPNSEGVLGMKAAAEYLMDIGMEEIEEYTKELNAYFVEKMQQLDNVILYNPKATAGIVTFNVKGIFAQDTASYLNTQHIAVRSGNHCAKLLLNVIGTSETVRASLYFYNTKEEIDQFVEVIKGTTIEKCIGVIL